MFNYKYENDENVNLMELNSDDELVNPEDEFQGEVEMEMINNMNSR